ncbi:MAG: PQQ-binding-like beta-propeller repeat protein, partial [Desulfobacterales bacterium]|nr:PQQ-binding-like beta-propeller repeat protein [Desulfobacterales bacterium]
AVEICGDGVDNDCSGGDLACDSDNDDDGWDENGGDCDDNNADIHPNAIDVCGDGIDQDCEGGDKPCEDANCLDLADSPMESQYQSAPAIIMFLLDNSGSMDWSFLTTETNGTFSNNYYLHDVDDLTYSSNKVISSATRDRWRARWHGYNRLYYNPNVVYSPWASTDMYPNIRAFDDADEAEPHLMLSHPVADDDTVDIDAIWTTAAVSGLDIPVGHYFVRYNTDVYLVTLSGGSIRYYRMDDPHDSSTLFSGLTEVTGSNIPPITSRTYGEERQNFANWFTFYRRRFLAASGALANIIQQMRDVKIGIYTINPSNGNGNEYIVQSPVPVRVKGEDQSETLINQLYRFQVPFEGTPLRGGLEDIGQFYDDTDQVTVSGLGASPYEDEEAGGACQQAFTVMMTDGHWTDNETIEVGDQDGDGWEDTLADIAMLYYGMDLSELPDQVPTNSVDTQSTQHMVTYGVAFGVKGSLDPESFPDCPQECTTLIPDCDACPDSWPKPFGSNGSKIDDFYHATVNGRGKVYSAGNPVQLSEALSLLLQDLEARGGSAASLGVNGDQVTVDTTIYQPSYFSEDWIGDVKAYKFNVTNGQLNSNHAWAASEQLESNLGVTGWATSGSGRKIITNDGNSAITFNTANATTIGLSAQYIKYIRGDSTFEGESENQYRQRDSKLGDIIHSSPVEANGLVFVGANDGMLHAFEASSGKERFAYIPGFVHGTLPELGRQYYSHRYYVDGTPYVQKIGSSTTYLVGGLGKGGKGVYCLDISSSKLNPTNENAARNIFKWVYPTTSDDDMGYSYSKPTIVNSTAGWVVIFGNGYGSTNGKAALYVVRLSDGALLKKIDTDFGNTGIDCNGLSTPVLIDVDRDSLVDYAYAGDLQGNLWKFDLTDSDVTKWDMAFKDGSDKGQPLFRALNEDGKAQPITHKPDVVKQCNRSKSGYLVVFGTGRYLGVDDVSNADVQTIYGIWDWVDEWAKNGTTDGEKKTSDKYLGTFQVPSQNGGKRLLSNLSGSSDLPGGAQEATLLEQTEVPLTNSTLRVLTNNRINWYTRSKDPETDETHVGWYFDLPTDRERVFKDFVVRDGVVVMVTTIPSRSVCQVGGLSYLMEFSACNGGRLPFPSLDIDNDQLIDESDKVQIQTGTPGTPGYSTQNVAPSGIQFNGLVNFPVILSLDENMRERKFLSSSEGNITTIDETPERRGIYSWRELE